MLRTCVGLTILIACGEVANAAVLTVYGRGGRLSGEVTLEVVLATSQGEEVAGTQNDLAFDPAGLHLGAASSCTINPEIGDDTGECEDDPSSGPCKQLSRTLTANEEGQRFRGLLLSLSNTTTIPDGPLYTCTLVVPFPIDAARLPTCPSALASDPAGGPIALPCMVDLSGVITECGEVPGLVSFVSMEMRPARPQVGDDVEIEFTVEARVFSRTGTSMSQSPELLDDVQANGLLFRARAAEAGRSNVRLSFTYATEQVCVSLTGERFFSPGPPQTAVSPEYEIEIAEAPSPTPTETQSPTPTSAGGDDGCAITPARTLGPNWVIFLGLLAAAVRRAHSWR